MNDKDTYRMHTKVIQIGDRKIGGGNPIAIQSMTNTKTEDVKATVEQILRLEKAGCEIIRCTVPTLEAAAAIREIKKQIHIPLVADIHFDYRMALAAIENGADKIRINPGNIGSTERVKAVVDAANSVSTKAVYEGLKLYDGMEHPDIDGVMEGIQQKDLKGVASHMGNILETVTIPMYPVIEDIKKLMLENGALNAMMSGSGPTVFGLFPNEKEIRRAYEALKQSGLAKNVYTSDIHNNRR